MLCDSTMLGWSGGDFVFLLCHSAMLGWSADALFHSFTLSLSRSLALSLSVRVCLCASTCSSAQVCVFTRMCFCVRWHGVARVRTYAVKSIGALSFSLFAFACVGVVPVRVCLSMYMSFRVCL
jgi:hypothetical protein